MSSLIELELEIQKLSPEEQREIALRIADRLERNKAHPACRAEADEEIPHLAPLPSFEVWALGN